jgi:hypothetical protein
VTRYIEGHGLAVNFFEIEVRHDEFFTIEYDREFARELWNLSQGLTGIYFQTEDFALFCCAL